MRKIKKICVLLLSMALIFGGLQIAPEYQSMAAKKKMKLSAKKLTLKVGKKKKLKVKNKKGKVKWKSSKKKVATVSKKGDVKAKKIGKVTITATITYKKKKTKLKCKVTVVKKGKATKKPTKKPTQKPINKPTQKPTNKPTPVKPSTASPIDTSKATEWNVEKQGEFLISGIQFADKSLTYQIPSDEEVVLVDTGTKGSVKEVVPDLSKCKFEVYAAGKGYSQTQTGDIKWSDKSYHPNNMGHGYYTFKLYIVKDGKTYFRTYKMADKIKTVQDDGENLTITSIQSGGKELALSKDRADARHYMMELSSGAANIKAMIPDMEKATFTVTYMGKKVTVEKVKDVQWESRSYYDDYEEGTGYYTFTLVVKNGSQQIELGMFLSDYNENLAVEEYSYSLNGTSHRETVRDYTSILTMEIEKGKTLKQVFPDVASAFTFTCSYHDRLFKDVKATEVVWKDTPYWENECDKGYYTFTLAVTVGNGKQVKRTFELVEEYQTITFAVSGTLKSGAGELVSGETLTFGTNSSETVAYKTKTGAGGTYSIDLPTGEWNVYWNKYKVDTITVGKEALTHNINAENFIKCSGTVSRLGTTWKDCDMEFIGDETVIVHSDANTGAFSVYLPKDETFYIFIDNFYMDSYSTYNAEGNITSDISCDYVKISGTIYQSGTTPLADGQFCICAEGQWDDEGKRFYTDENGKYQIYVDKNSDISLKHIDSGSTIGEFSVTDTDVTRDMTVGVTHVTGLLTAMNGDVLSEYGIDLKSEDGLTGNLETDEEGRYSAYLKPGTYTATVSDMAECTQKVVVGSQSVVCNLQAKLYKVGGQVTNNGEPWKNLNLYLCQKGEEDEGGWGDVSDENGQYGRYLSEGTWIIYPEGFSKESGVEVKVTGDTKKDLQFSFREAKGHIYRKEGIEFEKGSGIFLIVEDPDGEQLEEFLHLDDSSEYHLYVSKPGKYKVYNGGNMQPLTTFTVNEGTPVTTHDIICNLNKVTGSVTGIRDGQERYLNFETEDGDTWSPNDTGEVKDEKMPYLIYLPAGNYQAYIQEGENPEKKEVTVTDDMTFDIAAKVTYRVSGTLSHFSKPWGGQDISFSESDSMAGGDNKSAVSKNDGSYEVYLSPGTYTVAVGSEQVLQGEGELLTVTVTDSDISRDISMDMIEISGKALVKGKPLQNETISFEYELEDGSNYIQSTSTDYEGNYKCLLQPSQTYQIIFNDLTIGTVSAEQQDIEKDLDINATKVSGKFKREDGTGISDANLYFCEQGTDKRVYAWASNWMDCEGEFSVYLAPGTYDVKYQEQMDSEKTVFTDLQVGESDIEQDIVYFE